LAGALRSLSAPAERMYAYQRVDTLPDKVAYLVGAIEGLRHVERRTNSRLGSADRPILLRIAQDWLPIVTNTMRELQPRAQLCCQLLTRRAWQSETVPLVFNLLNEGPSAALNIRLSLAPAPEYTLVSEIARLERLGVGEDAQMELHVRPRQM